jgi:hypothetical protein
MGGWRTTTKGRRAGGHVREEGGVNALGLNFCEFVSVWNNFFFILKMIKLFLI